MLYHRDVFMPKRFIKQLPKNVRILNYSKHAINEIKNDRYGKVDIPESIKFEEWEVIEVETFDNISSHKVVIRKNFGTKDICLAVIVKENFVKTFWINMNNDVHKTLNKERYVKRD